MNPALIFWPIAFVLVVATLAALLWPLLRARHAASASAADATTAIFRDQKRALDADLAAGVITVVERDTAIDELASRFGTELAAPAAAASPAVSRSRWIAALVLVGLVPATALILYAVLGNPDALRAGAAGAGAAGEHKVTQEQIVAMVDSLARKMEANPENVDGWLLLARSYNSLGRYDGASRAYEQAAKRAPPDASLFADWADSLAMTQGRRLAGKPEELVARALALDPAHKKSLALAATAALERRDFDKALGYWRKLQQLEPPGSEQATQIGAVIAEVEEERGKAGPGKGKEAPGPRAALAAAPAQASPAAPAPIPSGAPPAPAPAAGEKTLSGVVEVAPAMKGRVAPEDTLYVFARAPSGSRAPLAVFRGSARDLPKTFMLDDSMGMGPGGKLSAAAEVVVEARVSKTGNALPQPGDLIGRTAPLAPGASNVRIVIDQAVP